MPAAVLQPDTCAGTCPSDSCVCPSTPTKDVCGCCGGGVGSCSGSCTNASGCSATYACAGTCPSDSCACPSTPTKDACGCCGGGVGSCSGSCTNSCGFANGTKACAGTCPSDSCACTGGSCTGNCSWGFTTAPCMDGQYGNGENPNGFCGTCTLSNQAYCRPDMNTKSIVICAQ